jgi:RecJ-like exonuclease
MKCEPCNGTGYVDEATCESCQEFGALCDWCGQGNHVPEGDENVCTDCRKRDYMEHGLE